MRRNPSISIAAVLSLLILACPLQAGELEMKVWDGKEHRAVGEFLGQQGTGLQPINAKTVGLPTGRALQGRFHVGRNPSQIVTLVFTAGEKNNSQIPDELRIALGNKPDVSQAQVFMRQPAPRSTRSSSVHFNGVQFSFSQNGQDHPLTIDITLHQANLSSHGYCTYKAKNFRAGTVNLDGQEVKVLLIDRTVNGLFDDRLTTGSGSPNSDLLLIDANANKKLDRGPSSSYRSYLDFGGEISPLTDILQINSAYYSYELGPNGSSLTLQRTEPQLGTVVSADSGLRAQLLGPVFISFSGPAAEPLNVPVGKYNVLQSTYIKKDESGRTWSLSAMTAGGKADALEVKPGQTTTIEPPKLIKLGASLRNSGRGKYISAEFTTADGLRITSIDVNGKRPNPPKFEIRDSSDKLIASGKLEYG